MKQSHIVASVFVVLLAAVGAAPSQAQVAAGAAIGLGWPAYDSYAPYRYGPYRHGWFGPWSPCGTSACVDDRYLRRAIQRELERFEYLRELEERTQGGFHLYATPRYGARGSWPPPTPEAQVQPAYRGSGEIRPEFSGTGQPRQDPARLLR